MKKSEELRVLHVAAALNAARGGSSVAAIEMCKGLVRQGLHVSLFTTNLSEIGAWSPLRRPEILDVPIEQPLVVDGVNLRYFQIDRPSRFAFSRSMARALKEHILDYDVVHVHSLYRFPGMVASRYAQQFAVPHVVSPHGGLSPFHRNRRRWRKALYFRLTERSNLDHAAAIHFTSQREVDLSRSLRLRAPHVVVPLGVDVDRFTDLPPRGTFYRTHRHLQGRRLVTFLGRLAPQKGLDLLVPAFAKAHLEHADAHLVLAGPDEEGYGTTVKRLLANNGVLEHSTITGMLMGEQKLSLLADTELWVLPSYDENFGIAVTEAMACGLPVLISDQVGIHEEIAQAGAGIVVPCAIDPLAAAISRILTDESVRRTLAESARRLVSEEYTWQKAAARMARLYQTIDICNGSVRD